MAAPKGNEFWRFRTKHGRNHAYTAEELLDEAERYFKRMATEKSARFYEPNSKMHFITPPSILSLCVHLGIGEATWYRWKDIGSQDLREVISYIETIIKARQFDGAAIGIFKANIMSRALGLAQKHEHSGPNGGPMETKDLSDDEFARRLRFLARKTGAGGAGAAPEPDPGDDGGPELVSE
jgi:hypothetical protein